MGPATGMMNDVSAPAQCLTMADFGAFERRYRLYHRFPSLNHDDAASTPVAEGWIDECRPAMGVSLVGSRLTIHHTYETHALADAPAHVSIIVILEGSAELLHGGQHFALAPREALMLTHAGHQTLSARHAGGQRLRAINLTLLDTARTSYTRLAAPLAELLDNAASGAWRLSLPEGVWLSLEEWLNAPLEEAQHALLGEGLALQLMAHGLAARGTSLRQDRRLGVRDRHHLARVRECLHEHPEASHSIESLAQLACMSPSALRDKFRQAYGQSVFECLRQRRLEMAHALLREGYSVQYVATRVGYRHASNFATAFKQRYGMSPRALHQRLPSAGVVNTL
ncbi:helix-turn-helix transcriptional regulator [Chromohalobacter sarecensis]|uniref:Helix-turn-helix transcriptional regulator n=1 Tax=Chromohalobacter sarecensis TaxID=245294 RepID=A0ABV9CX73_9GAMM|nr:AraC family transcriptional regulator [Chromohalobacter sarecensis]MCK0714898.1 helix-turn-helix transcriptional regulator [Chromohalobacter sarecensis]